MPLCPATLKCLHLLTIDVHARWSSLDASHSDWSPAPSQAELASFTAAVDGYLARVRTEALAASVAKVGFGGRD